VTDGIVTVTTLFKNITHFSMTNCGNAWEILRQIGNTNKLEWLELSVPRDSYSCKGRDTIWPKWTVPQLPILLPHLESLRIIDLGFLDEFIEFVLPGLPQLKYVHNMNYSDDLAAGLVKYCTNIEKLHINQPTLHDVGMAHLLSLPKLRSLKFYCLNQSSWSGKIPSNVRNTSLENLELGSMSSVKSILPTAKACPNLKEFTGEYLTLPSPEPKKFMKALPHLKRFFINREEYLPKKAIESNNLANKKKEREKVGRKWSHHEKYRF